MIPSRHHLLAAFIFFGLIGVGQAQIKVQSGQKVAFLGDSITQFGWDRPGGYVHLVAEALDSAGVKITVIPAGVSGNTSNDMLRRLGPAVIERKPDWLTVSCGVNDVWHHDASHVDLDTYKANITSIVDKAQAAGIKVVILTATMINEGDNTDNKSLATYNDFLIGLAKERNLPLADLNAACWKVIKDKAKPGTNVLTVDGVHMNPDGNMVMARGVLEAFGMPADQIDTFEKNWRQSPTAAAVTAQITVNAAAPTSIAGYNAVVAAAAEQRVRPGDVLNNLLFESLRTVMKAHEGDATFTPAQAQGELQAAFKEKVQAFVEKAEKH